MSGEKKEQHKAEVKRRRVRQMVEAGYSLAAIRKETGYSYAHVKQLAEQEKPND